MSAGEAVATEAVETDFDAAPLEELLEKYRGQRGSMIPLLQGTQAIYGYLPEEALKMIAQVLGEPLSKVFGVATFFSQFRLTPRGENVIRVCHGTACHVSGASLISQELERNLGIEEGGNTDDMMFTLEVVACLGACGMAPVMMINDRTIGKLTADKAVQSVKAFRAEQLGDEEQEDEEKSTAASGDQG